LTNGDVNTTPVIAPGIAPGMAAPIALHNTTLVITDCYEVLVVSCSITGFGVATVTSSDEVTCCTSHVLLLLLLLLMMMMMTMQSSFAHCSSS